MVTKHINNLLNADEDSQLVSRSKVIDHLLDVRLMADTNADLVSRVDRVLSQVPGVTVVSLIWWRSTLADLHEISKPSSIAA